MWKVGIWAGREMNNETPSLAPPLPQESEGFSVAEIKAVLPSRAFEAKTQWLRAFADTREMMGHRLQRRQPETQVIPRG